MSLPKKLKVKKFKRYSIRAIEAAKDAVRNNSMSVYKAAKRFGIPESTIRGHLKRKHMKRKLKDPTYLSFAEEAKLINWVKEMAKRFLPISRQSIIHEASLKIQRKFKKKENFLVSKKWFEGFSRRYPDITSLLVSRIKTKKVTEQDLHYWHAIIQGVLEENGLMDHFENHPECILNGEETGFLLVPEIINKKCRVNESKVLKVVYEHAYEVPYETQTTAIYTISGDGHLYPPMIVYRNTNDLLDITNSLPGEFGILCGNMKSKLMVEYMKWILARVKERNIAGPYYFFLDQHKSLLTSELVDFCRDNNIHLFGFYARFTRILQPLDVGLFDAIKKKYKSELDSWKVENRGKTFQVRDVAPIIKRVNDSVCTVEAIQETFLKSGLVPFDAENTDYTLYLQIKSADSSSENQREENSANEHFADEHFGDDQSDDERLGDGESNDHDPLGLHDNPPMTISCSNDMYEAIKKSFEKQKFQLKTNFENQKHQLELQYKEQKFQLEVQERNLLSSLKATAPSSSKQEFVAIKQEVFCEEYEEQPWQQPTANRGRPKKLISQNLTQDPSTPKRPRGRPRKSAEIKDISMDISDRHADSSGLSISTNDCDSGENKVRTRRQKTNL